MDGLNLSLDPELVGRAFAEALRTVQAEVAQRAQNHAVDPSSDESLPAQQRGSDNSIPADAGAAVPSKILEAYVLRLKARGLRNRNTLSTYRSQLRGFERLAQEHIGADRRLHQMKAHEIEETFGLVSERMALATRNALLIRVRDYFGFLADRGIWTGENPVAALRIAPVPRVRRPYLSEAVFDAVATRLQEMAAQQFGEIKAVMRLAREGGASLLEIRNACRPIRDWAMLMTMLYTGVRRAELCGLALGDLMPEPFAPEQVRVVGKRSKERTLPLHPRAQRALIYWLKLRAAIPQLQWQQKIDPVFVRLPRSTRRARLAGIARNTVVRVVVKYLAPESQELLELGFGKGMHPHALRRTFATRLIRKGADLERVRRLMGHEDISTTSRYVEVETEHLREAVDLL